jgi:hypothetical protein
MDARAEIEFKNGGKQRVEFYYGNTYLSQSSRKFPVNDQVSSLIIFDFAGNSRNIDLKDFSLVSF